MPRQASLARREDQMFCLRAGQGFRGLEGVVQRSVLRVANDEARLRIETENSHH